LGIELAKTNAEKENSFSEVGAAAVFSRIDLFVAKVSHESTPINRTAQPVD
jgi:hypothetical protein